MARPPDTCSLQQGRQAPSFKGRGKVWSGAPWCHHSSLHLGWGLEGRHSLLFSGLGTQGARLGLLTWEMQASEISDIHRLKSSWKRGRCLIPQGPGPCAQVVPGVLGGRETGERQAPEEVSHVLAFSCIWGVKPHKAACRRCLWFWGAS